MFEYNCKIVRVVDGDTVDVNIDLGFGLWIHKERIRLYGIDTPESRTRDLVEKKYGLFAKKFVEKYIPVDSIQILRTQKDRSGKFGRVLGEIFVSPDAVGENAVIPEEVDRNKDGLVSINDILIAEGHAYDYHGGKKKDFEAEIAKEKAAKKEDLVDKPAEEEAKEE